MTLAMGGTTFDRVDYDAEADVLYLHVGDPSSAVGFDESPEGHSLRYDGEGHLVGITIVGARAIIGSGERLVVTVSERLELSAAQLKPIIAA